MNYIVDANNLAGKLKILGDKHFDKKLIELIKKYIVGKTNQWELVFDSVDPMGDKSAITEYLIVIYTPKDKYYESADDKIVEIVEKKLSFGYSKLSFDQITVITDDNELRRRVKKLEEDLGRAVILERATAMAEKLKEFIKTDKDDGTEDGSRGLSGEERKKIDDELLDIWG